MQMTSQRKKMLDLCAGVQMSSDNPADIYWLWTIFDWLDFCDYSRHAILSIADVDSFFIIDNKELQCAKLT
uniref:Uncharacterized protein n=1 Tax=viral metagenome TaxID=1070528 RepID=A0A6M3KRN5_9ZZZZ